MNAYLTNKGMARLDEQFKVQHELLDIMKLVVSEWESDPMSTQCFDLRIIDRAKLAVAKLKKLDPLF